MLWIWPSFSDSSRGVAMASNFEVSLADLPSFGTLAFRNELEYRNADGRNELAYIMYKTSVNWVK